MIAIGVPQLDKASAIFGGWVMALMDAAGAMTATRIADGRVVTASVSNITFLHPLQAGDAVCCYAQIARIGQTSLTLTVEVWVLREGRGDRIKVTNAKFSFVAVDTAGRPAGCHAACDHPVTGVDPAVPRQRTRRAPLSPDPACGRYAFSSGKSSSRNSPAAR